jgi:hypothetical protein
VHDLGYGMASTFASLSDSGSSELNLVPSIHVASSANSQGETYRFVPYQRPRF